jgi:multidrug efflux system outer membrane protein
MAALFAGACNVGPEYERPDYPVPESHRFEVESPAPDAKPLADLSWLEMFQDPVLVDLITAAVAGNYDVRLAAERIREARALYEIARGAELPVLDANASIAHTGITRNGIPPLGSGPERDGTFYAFGGVFSWEIDFWGRLNSATEAARAELFAAAEDRRDVIQVLATEVARAYIELLDLDAELAIARDTLVSRRESLRLVMLRRDQGIANDVEVRQSEVLVITAQQTIPEFERRIGLKENEISVLLGGNPAAILRGRTLRDTAFPGAIPAGLPSEVLEKRRDIRAAEERLVAANARIGEARGLLYPRISLTGQGGLASEDLGDLFQGSSSFWDIGVALTQPIFNGGRLRANVRATEARQEQAVILYLQTLQNAFREVSDALIGYRKLREFREHQDVLTSTLEDQRRLSELRYRGGVTAYLEVLDTERQLFDAQLGLVQARRNELLAIVALYRAVGGGWLETAPATTAETGAGE